MNRNAKNLIGTAAQLFGAGLALAFGTYAATVAVTWCLYDSPRRRLAGQRSKTLLDEFVPDYEVIERHSARIKAPVEIASAAACSVNFQHSAVVRAIFRTRELVLGTEPRSKKQQLGLVDQAKAWGWGVLAEVPGREILFGGITQPWLPDPKFQALPPEDFAKFNAPGYVKIAWNLRTDPVTDSTSLASTETRVATTDPVARQKFRTYWSFVRPGSVLIRRMGLRLIKAEAERCARIPA